MFHSCASVLPAELSNLTLFLALGAIAAMLFSIAKAGFGGSIGLLAVPVMIYACGGDSPLAIGIMLPLLITCDFVAVFKWWRKWNTRSASILLPGAVTGIILGFTAMWGMEQLETEGGQDLADAALKLGIGLIALLFVILQAIRALRSKPLPFKPVWWQGSAVGTVAGFTSSLAHSAGPVVAMYMLPQQMTKGQYVATTVFTFWLVNLMKVPVYVALGRINTGTLSAGLMLFPAVVAGTLLGVFLHRKVGRKQFNVIVYVLLTLAAADLIYKGITGL
ncbi:MAG: sulfite exporter TauE/SafE family protein [Phycisphaerae bacterium]